MSPEEIISVRNYLCKRLGNEGITIKPRKVSDSVEVYLNDEILGLLYVDNEDPDEVSYDLNISILQVDLDEA